MPLLIICALTVTAPAAPQAQAEKEIILTITAPELKGGVISEITWDGKALMLQGVFAEAGGELKAQYFIIPAESTRLEQRTDLREEVHQWSRDSGDSRPPLASKREVGRGRHPLRGPARPTGSL